MRASRPDLISEALDRQVKSISLLKIAVQDLYHKESDPTQSCRLRDEYKKLNRLMLNTFEVFKMWQDNLEESLGMPLICSERRLSWETLSP